MSRLPKIMELSIKTSSSRILGVQQVNPLTILLPDQPIVRSISGDVIPGLEVDEMRTVTLAFVANPDMDLGQFFFGTIVFSTDGISTTLSYKATVVSTVPASLTVITENEATYFGEGNPNLANVLVSVRSLSTGESYTLDSGLGRKRFFPGLG